MGRKRKAEKEKKRKKVSITPIEREHAGKVTEPYKVMEGLVAKHHKHLNEAEARIAMAWDEGPAKEDADGFVKFGRVKRGADIDRAYAPFDFWLIVRREVWSAMDTTRKQAEIDRLLCRCMVMRDRQGEIMLDEKGRGVFRLRKPIEVFPENVARFGFHQEPKLADCLSRFNDAKRPLLKGQDDKPAKGRKKSSRFSEPANKPEAIETNGHANGEHVDWQAQGIEVLELPHPVFEALKSADLNTLGDVARYQDENGNVGLDQIKGMGGERGELLRELFGRYRSKHPDLFPELAESAS